LKPSNRAVPRQLRVSRLRVLLDEVRGHGGERVGGEASVIGLGVQCCAYHVAAPCTLMLDLDRKPSGSSQGQRRSDHRLRRRRLAFKRATAAAVSGLVIGSRV
jgi:hypothetical protein